MTNQKFNIVGIVVRNNNAKVHFTNDLARRVKQYSKGGATRVDFVELPKEVTKLEALRQLLTLPQFASAEDQATINDSIEDRVKEARKGEVKVKSKTTKTKGKTATKPSLAALKNRKKAKSATAEDVLAAVKEPETV